jgi:hypothetical protein
MPWDLETFPTSSGIYHHHWIFCCGLPWLSKAHGGHAVGATRTSDWNASVCVIGVSSRMLENETSDRYIPSVPPSDSPGNLTGGTRALTALRQSLGEKSEEE